MHGGLARAVVVVEVQRLAIKVSGGGLARRVGKRGSLNKGLLFGGQFIGLVKVLLGDIVQSTLVEVPKELGVLGGPIRVHMEGRKVDCMGPRQNSDFGRVKV